MRPSFPPYSRTVDVVARLGWRDALLPALLLAFGAAELASLGTDGWVASVGLEAISAACLVFRRTHALFVVPPSAIALMVIPLTGTQMDEAATPILFYILGIYSLGRYLSGHSGLVALTLTLLLVFADFFFAAPDNTNDWTDVVFVLSLAIPPYVFGRISRKLAMQSEELARQQELIRDQAVRGERDRIARELHDVIAHSLSAMVVQTAAAQDLVRSSPERASALLASVADTGRKALEETGRLLHLIRDDADELGLHPAPGLADVPRLVSTFRESGLEVVAALDLPTVPLPGGVDVSAYRVVQEALTNALKYADGPVQLSIASTPEQLHVCCANRVGRAGSNGSGLGLQGMAERVGLLGGTLTSGRTPDGGFVVEADIPLMREGVS